MAQAEAPPAPAPAAPREEDRLSAKARAVAFHVAWLGICLLVFGWYYSDQFRGLQQPDAMDAAQVARHIGDGHGFTTSVVRPLSFAKVPRALGHPDLYNPPLYPLVLAAVMNSAGPKDSTVAFCSLVFGILTAIMAFLLGARLANQWVGALAALLVTLNLGMLTISISGANIALAAFLTTTLFYLVARDGGTIRWAAAAGALCGLAYLSEFSLLSLAVVAAALVALSRPQGRVARVIVFGAAFVMVVAPWLVRNWRVAGSPFAGLQTYSVAMYGSTHPGTTVFRSTQPERVAPWRFLSGGYREVARKLLLSLWSLESGLVGAYGICLLITLGVALVMDLGSGVPTRLKWAFVVAAAALAVSLAAGQPRGDAGFGLVGLAAAVGAAGFAAALSSRGLSARLMAAAVGLLLLAAAYPVAVQVLLGRVRHSDTRNLEYLSRVLPAAAIVMTDRPVEVAWYAGRAAVWLPLAPMPSQRRMRRDDAATPERFPGYQALTARGLRPDAIYLSYRVGTLDASEAAWRWQELHKLIAEQLYLIEQRRATGTPWVPPGWTLAASLPPQDFLLLRTEAVTGGRVIEGDR